MILHELDSFIAEVLVRPTTIVGDRSWPDGRSVVIEVRDGDGTTWFVKRHQQAGFYRTEVAAYRRWVPALGDRAPQLRAADDRLQALVLSAVPGEFPDGWLDESVQRDAGKLLRQLHDAAQLGAWNTIAADKEAELAEWAARATRTGLLERREVAFARSAVRGIGRLPVPMSVPCHLDYTPRNWLVADGRVHVMDFEEAGPEAWVNDVGRLYFGWWGNRPDMRDAFFDGYGRRPTADELALMRGSYAVTAIRLVVLARELGKTAAEASVREVLRGLMRGDFD